MFHSGGGANHHRVTRFAHMEWTYGMRCHLHIGEGGCKWGANEYNSVEGNSNAHLVIASLQNSSHALSQTVNLFIRTKVVYVNRNDSLVDPEILWPALGVANLEMILLYVEVNPQWDPVAKVLRVCTTLRGQPDCYGEIYTAIMYSLQWVDWSDTRWAKMAI